MVEYTWEWIEYPHGNQELVEKTTDSCLEQLASGKDGQARFLLSRPNPDHSHAQWLITLGDDVGLDWFEVLKTRANEILDAPADYPQYDFD